MKKIDYFLAALVSAILLLLVLSQSAYCQKAIRGNGAGTTTATVSTIIADSSAEMRQWVLDQGYGIGTGDITAVTAVDGLAGGGTSGAVTLAVNPKLTGSGRVTITAD